MGYGGKIAEQRRARELRAQSWTLLDIARELGVSKSSVSLWVRDVDFEPNPRRRTSAPRPSSLHLRKLDEIERLNRAGADAVGRMNEREFLLVGLALYVGEGFKGDGDVGMANTDPQVLSYFATWLRRCFGVPEPKFRVRLYLHEGLGLEAAKRYWSELLGVPRAQFIKPYQAAADPTRRTAKHIYGCPAVRVSSSCLHRQIMGMAVALLSSEVLPG